MKSKIPNPAYQSSTEAGARALEVTALLGDSVVGLGHVFASPQLASGRRARILFAAGAALLLLSAITFAYGVHVAAVNDGALARFTAQGRPAYEFRPRQLGAGFDLMALGGLAGGVICVGFGLALRGRNRRRDRFTVGRDPDADFATDEVPADRFDLVAATGAGPRVRTWQGMDAVLFTPTERLQLSELVSRGIAEPTGQGGHSIRVPEGARLTLVGGPVRFFVGWAPAPSRRGALFQSRFESRATAFVAASAAVHLALLALFSSVPPDGDNLSLDDQDRPMRLATARFTPNEPPRPEEGRDEDAADRAEKPGESVAQGKKGTIGEPKANATEGRAAIARRAETPQLARRQAMDQARQRGIAGALASRRDLFASLTSQNPFSSGFDDEDVRGGAYGDQVGAVFGAYGEWGNAVTDISGSPYWHDGLVRAGKLKGGRPYGDARYGGGGDGPGLRQHHLAKRPTVDTGPATVPPEWDPAIIRRHIRRQLSRIEHCYEKSLLVKPSLSGTAVASFTITPEGKVLGASTTGMSDAGLHRCISGVVSRIEFPRSPNGAAANVRYPFHLHRAGR